MTDTLSEAPTLPLHMRRAGFDPVAEMREMRDDEGVRRITTSFGSPAFLVARHADVKTVLADSARFSNAGRRLFQAPTRRRSPMRSSPGSGPATCSASTRPSTPGCGVW